MNDEKLLTYLKEFKKQLTILKNMVQNGAPQVESYHINSKTSFLKDKVEDLDNFLNDIVLDLIK